MASPIIISIEGNIGSGKSTLLKHLKETMSTENIVFVDEPVKEWENVKNGDGRTILELFYENPEEYAFSFQMMAYISRLSYLKKAIRENPNAVIISERCLLTDKHVFAKMLYDDEKISQINYSIYNQWFDEFIHDLPITNVIYIKTQPSICFERVNKRSRNGENNIALEYLARCHEYHETMIDSIKTSCKKCITLEGDYDIYENESIINRWTSEISNLINLSIEKNDLHRLFP